VKVLPLRRQLEQRRLLLLEDHDLLRQSMVRTLSELPDVSVVAVATVAAAIRELEAAPPNLIVSDLDLPDGSGLELMAHLEGPEPPAVVFVSGHISRFESQLDRYPGVVVLDKPMPARTLQYIVKEQLGTERANIAPFAAGDYIQLACLGRHSVRIDVRGRDFSGWIYVRQGRIWAAHAGHRTGLRALRKLTFIEGTHVTCSGVSGDEGPSNLPDLPWEQMLLDLAKEYDEGTREIPVAQTEPDPEEFDFSNLFDESESAEISAPATPSTSEAASAPDDEEARYERLLDDAHDRLLEKDYVAALTAFEAASALRPQDSVVKGNVARLRELVSK